MITAQITVTGLAMVCLNDKRAEIGIVDDGPDGHELKITISQIIQKLDGTFEIVPKWTSKDNQNFDAAGPISFKVNDPVIKGIMRDESPIDRIEGPNAKNVTSLKWLLDMEGQEMHRRRMVKKPIRPTLRKMTIPDAYVFTADVRADSGYLVRRPDGSIHRFGRIGHKIGAMLYGSSFEMHVGTLQVFPENGSTLPENSNYHVLIENLEKSNGGRSDFDKYYQVVSAGEPEFSFLSAPRFRALDELEDLVPNDDWEKYDKGVHYECWICYCSSTQSIDEFM